MGPFYFAWVNQGTPFSPTLYREDEVVYSFAIEQNEGEAATLQMEIKNPLVGLLAPGRLVWAWLSWSDGTTVHPLFFGRLISVPDDMFGEVVSLRLVAMPPDFIEQKRSVAATLQARPFYDPVFVEPARRLDPDTMLEGRSALWHIDRTTHAVTVSDILVGEDGVVDIPEAAIPYDSVKMSVDQAPLKSVAVDATVAWEQEAHGSVDLGTQYFRSYSGDGLISSWPRPDASLGQGWGVDYSLAVDVYNVAIAQTLSMQGSWTNPAKKHNPGDTISINWSRTTPVLAGPYYHAILTQGGTTGHISENPDEKDEPTSTAVMTDVWVPEWLVAGSLVLRYDAKRSRSENIRFVLGADLQPVFTDPGDSAADFAQDAELISLNGSVGNEGPYGVFRGDWQAGASYARFDYFMAPDGRAYSVLKDHVALSSFSAQQTATLWQPDKRYNAGDNVYSGGQIYAVLVTHVSGGSFDPTSLAVNGTLIYDLRISQSGGAQLYGLMQNFRGHWAASTIYVASDTFLAPDSQYYQVNTGHVSAATFDPFAADLAGRMLYALLLNPPPIGDISRSNYFPSDRGLWSVEHLICRARAHLLLRARAVKVSCDVPFPIALGLSLRKNAIVRDRRIPGGYALGKVVGYSLHGSGDSGELMGNVSIGCAVGNGNAVVGLDGEPSYVEDGYVSRGYQLYEGATTVLPAGDVAYAAPIAGTVDDGLVFPLDISQAVVSQRFQTASVAQQEAIIEAYQGQQKDQQKDTYIAAGVAQQFLAQLLADQAQKKQQQIEAFIQALTKTPTWYELVLRPVVNGPFAAEYDVSTSALMIPRQIDLANT